MSVIRWRGKGHCGSAPLACFRIERSLRAVAATEHAQREVALARAAASLRCCGRPGLIGASLASVDPDTAAPDRRRSTVAPQAFLQLSGSLSASSAFRRPAALSHQQAFCFSLSSNATGFRVDQDDAAGLAVERAFDYHLSDREAHDAACCLSLEAAQCDLNLNSPSRFARPVYPRTWKPGSTC